jgi:dihydrofolate reductase
MLNIIVAIDSNNAIGFENKLLCHLPNDLKNFKRITTGHTVIMGRLTYCSLPIKPLPNRKNVVISRSIADIDGCVVLNSVEDIIRYCADNQEYFIIGGAQIYNQMMPFADRIYLTRINHHFEADTWFPKIDKHEWNLVSKQENPKDEKHLYEYSFEIYTRIKTIIAQK